MLILSFAALMSCLDCLCKKNIFCSSKYDYFYQKSNCSQMKNIFITAALVFISSSTFAQTFSKDSVHFNFGVGIGWPYEFEEEYDKLWSLPAFTASIEKGFFSFDSIGSISVGVSTSYKYFENKRNNKVAQWNNFLIGAMARFNFYFLNDKKLIPYIGVFGGINTIKFKDNFYAKSNDYPTNYNGIFPIAYVFAGVKYISKPTFGIYGEVSYGFTYLTLGIYKVL